MIREMSLADISQVISIEELCLPNHWRESDFKYEILENPYAKLFVDELNGFIRGYIGIWIIFERVEITTLAVSPSEQRKGIADSLLKFAIRYACENDCEVCFLEVRISNKNAISLYRKNGFNDWRIKKDYYQNNHEDALEMIRSLGGKCEAENFSY